MNKLPIVKNPLTVEQIIEGMDAALEPSLGDTFDAMGFTKDVYCREVLQLATDRSNVKDNVRLAANQERAKAGGWHPKEVKGLEVEGLTINVQDRFDRTDPPTPRPGEDDV